MSLASVGFMSQKHPLTIMLMGALSAKFNLKGLGNSILLIRKIFKNFKRFNDLGFYETY